jgi:hypothetical protein
MSNVKICWKGRVSECFYSNFEKRGVKILMTCHLFLDNFSWNFVTFGLFSKVRSFWNEVFVSRKLKYHDFEIYLFLNSVFLRKMCYCRNLIVFSCLQFADCYIWPRIYLFCGVILCFNHCYGIFWKVSLKKSWCCRKHVLVFKIVSLKGLNKFRSNHSFPIKCWVEDLFALMEKVRKLFRFGSWLF